MQIYSILLTECWIDLISLVSLAYVWFVHWPIYVGVSGVVRIALVKILQDSGQSNGSSRLQRIQHVKICIDN